MIECHAEYPGLTGDTDARSGSASRSKALILLHHLSPNRWKASEGPLVAMRPPSNASEGLVL